MKPYKRKTPKQSVSSIQTDSSVQSETVCNPPIDIVFNCHEGSVSHYFHFFYGALIPLIIYYLYHLPPNTQLIINTNVGPFKNIINDVFPNLVCEYNNPQIKPNKKYIDDKSMNKVRIKKDGEVILQAFDLFNKTFYIKKYSQHSALYKRLIRSRSEIIDFVSRRMINAYGRDFVKQIPISDIILIKRKTDPYYIQKREQNQDRIRDIFFTSGNQRRNILNYDELAFQLESIYGDRFQSISLEGQSIFYQCHVFSNAKIIIAQHGAALANIYFCSPNANIIEITSPWAMTGEHFKNLSNFLHLGYHSVCMEKDIGNVDVNQVLEKVYDVVRTKLRMSRARPTIVPATPTPTTLTTPIIQTMEEADISGNSRHTQRKSHKSHRPEQKGGKKKKKTKTRSKSKSKSKTKTKKRKTKSKQ